MSLTPTTPTKSGTSKLSIATKSKRHRRKRRNSNHSNASIVSIDPLTMRRVRAIQAKVAKEKKLEKELYRQQKKSKFEDYTKKYIAAELKEEDEYNKVNVSNTNLADFETTKPLKKIYHESYDSTSSKDTGESVDSAAVQNPQQQAHNITVDELLPIIKDLLDRDNKLQEEYEILQRDIEEQRIVYEDKVTQLEGELQDALQGDIPYGDMEEYGSMIDTTRSSGGTAQHAANMKHVRQEYEDKIAHLKNNYENNLFSIQSQFEQEVETQKKDIHSLTKDLNDADKEIDALRQTVEALEHENQSLRIQINNNNKQFQNTKLYRNKNNALLLENEALKQQIDALASDLNQVIQEQEEQAQQQQDISNNMYLNQNIVGTKTNPNQRPQTPTHAYTRTVVMGTRDALEITSSKGYSDHETSSMGGNDLLQQIGDELLDNNTNQSSVDPPLDRGSNYGDDYDQHSIEYEDDEKKINDDSHSSRTIAKLSKFKKIGAMDPDSMATIRALLEQKDKNRNQGSMDNYSVASNYSDSQQKLEEQIDAIEDDIRELKDMILSLMDSTNNIQPSINSHLGPLIRKINRMYVMLSGPMAPQVQQVPNPYDDDQSSSYGRNYDDRVSSEHSYNTKSSRDGAYESWLAFLSPHIHEWMPSIGFSAIILSTMYLLIKYHRGRFIGIGPPRVLRNKRN